MRNTKNIKLEDNNVDSAELYKKNEAEAKRWIAGFVACVVIIVSLIIYFH